jgi:hypothetical protein
MKENLIIWAFALCIGLIVGFISSAKKTGDEKKKEESNGTDNDSAAH